MTPTREPWEVRIRAIFIDPRRRILRYEWLDGRPERLWRLLQSRTLDITHFPAIGISYPAAVLYMRRLQEGAPEKTSASFSLAGHQIDGRALIVGHDRRLKRLIDCPDLHLIRRHLK